MHWIKVEPRYYQAQGPPLSIGVSFVRIDPGDWNLPHDNQRVSSSVFQRSQIIIVVGLVTRPREVLGVFDWCDHSLDCEEGCQVGRVRGDNNEGEEPPDTPHDTRGSSFGVQTGTLQRKTRFSSCNARS